MAQILPNIRIAIKLLSFRLRFNAPANIHISIQTADLRESMYIANFSSPNRWHTYVFVARLRPTSTGRTGKLRETAEKLQKQRTFVHYCQVARPIHDKSKNTSRHALHCVARTQEQRYVQATSTRS